MNEKPTQHLAERWITTATVICLLAYFIRVILRHYFIRASSDPHNWVIYAYNFRTEVLESRWPYGFPLFLRLMLPITGSYYIFLVNLPLLVLAFLLIWRLAAWTNNRQRQYSHGSAIAGICALALALTANASELIQYVNPYRDPLSYVLLLAAVWTLARALTARRLLQMAVSGVLLGLACSVREPSVLMLLPLALYGITEWYYSDSEVPFWKSVGCFAGGFSLALIPLGIQTWLATRQLFLPPQAAMQASIVPGAHFRWLVFSSVSSGAWHHYLNTQVWIPLLAAAGLLNSIRCRHRLMLALIAPAAALYFVFYSFYMSFVPRYFYITTLLFCILGGYGVSGMLQLATCRLPGAWGRRTAWIAAILVCILCARQFRRAQRPQPPLQVADAKAFTEDLIPLVPENAVIFSQRNLCELINVVVRRESYAWAFKPGMIMDRVEQLWADGRPVYTMEVPSPLFPFGDTIHLRRLYDLEHIATFDPDKYDMAGFAPGPFHLHLIRQPVLQRVESTIASPPPGDGWIVIDPGYLPAISPERSYVTIQLDERDLTNAIHWKGAQFLNIEMPEKVERTLQLAIESDGLLPKDIRVAAESAATPFDLDFDLHATFDHRWRWQGGILPPDLIFRKPRLVDEASFTLPRIRPGKTIMEWHVRSTARNKGGTENILLFDKENLLATLTVRRDHSVQEFIVELPEEASAEEERCIRIIREQPDIGIPPEMEIHRLILHRPVAGQAIDLLIGTPGDALYILKGFYHREGIGTPESYRWTDGCGELRLPSIGTGSRMVLQIHASVEHTPPELRPMTLTVFWNGREITAETIETDAGGVETVWTSRLSPDQIQSENLLALQTPPWYPKEHGGADTRRLGVMLRRIEWEPAE